MNFEYVKKISKPFAVPSAIDRRLSIRRRLLVQRTLLALFILAIALAFGSIMVPFAGYPIYVGMGLILFGIWIGVFALNMYVFSYQFREFTDNPPVTFEVAAVVTNTSSIDVTLGFFSNRFGLYLWRRLGLTSTDLEQFASQREEPKHDLTVPDGETVDLHAYAKLIYDNDSELRRFLASRRITEEIYDGAARWVLSTIRRIKIMTRWWARSALRSRPRLGVDWSFGVIGTLQQFAVPVRVRNVGVSTTESYYDDIADRIESAISREQSANALVVAEEGSGVRYAFEAIVRRIRNESISAPLAHDRLYRLDVAQLIGSVSSKAELEKLSLKLLHEAQQAGNIVLVIEHFANFIEQAREYGVNVIDILEPYLETPDLHFIVSTDPHTFHNKIETEHRITRWFEAIKLDVQDERKVNELLAIRAEVLEARHGVMISYPALHQVFQGAMNYLTSTAMPESALTLLSDLASRAAQEGRNTVTRKFVNTVLEEKTGIKTGEIKDDERNTLKDLERLLHKRIVGQDQAIRSVSDALRRARSGIANRERPFGAFLFLGPTGVGKTETAKALADVFFDGHQDVVRLDMSEFTGPKALTRLIGDQNANESGVLVQKVRENPYSVLLLDEFEKTTRETHDLFLRVFDEGVFHDAFGERINLRNMIIIATSNAGSDEIHRIVGEGKELVSQKDSFLDMLINDRIFRPELLNRFDDIVLFHPLTRKQLVGVARRELAKLGNRLEQRGISFEITEPLIAYLVEHGYDRRFGARAMQRVIQNDIEKIASQKIISGEVAPGETLRINEEELAQRQKKKTA